MSNRPAKAIYRRSPSAYSNEEHIAEYTIVVMVEILSTKRMKQVHSRLR